MDLSESVFMKKVVEKAGEGEEKSPRINIEDIKPEALTTPESVLEAIAAVESQIQLDEKLNPDQLLDPDHDQQVGSLVQQHQDLLARLTKKLEELQGTSEVAE